jgi:hypothetical protein
MRSFTLIALVGLASALRMKQEQTITQVDLDAAVTQAATDVAQAA